jgi:lysozyme
MRCSDSGIAFIREAEGCKLQAYKDGGGVWTIGVGHIKGVHQGQYITQFEADELLKMDLEDHDISLLLGDAQTSQNQFDAMSSLAFNIGIDAFAGSTGLKRHKLGNFMGAANAFLMWNKDNGKVVPGLTRRREAERKLYLGEVA